ncbi:MAG TPA: hypothetical protein VFC19_21450 [Candidatus Limnocylindrales bacterium]|nr:hypothetical protein [Candidatus Limnocylindrales bacterium]
MKTATIGRLILAVTVLAAGGCTGGSPAGDQRAEPAATASADPARVWRELVACARAHGQANMPDPVVEPGGGATFPQAPGFNAKSAIEAVRADCGAILDRLPPGANPLAMQQVTHQQLDLYRQYSQCMRDNGIADFPDPNAEGSWSLPSGFWTPDRQRQDPIARNVCEPLRLQADSLR